MARSITAGESEKVKFVTNTYSWMGIALLISAFAAYITAKMVFTDETQQIRTAFGDFLFGGYAIGFWIFAILELVLVFLLSSSIRKISLQTAVAGFILYALINGVTLSSIFAAYKLASIAKTFIVTAAMFGTMAIYGSVTKRNLMTLGRYLLMALVGIIIASVVQFVFNRFLKLNTTLLDFIISIVSVIVFTGLTAYDSQKIMKIAFHSNGNNDYKKISIMAALEIYLDFINLFLTLLRFFGKQKDD